MSTLADVLARETREGELFDTLPDGRLRCLAWQAGGTTQLWLANLRDEPVEVRLDGSRATRVARLDEASFATAAADPAFMDKGRPFAGNHLSLDALAVARLEIGD